MKNFYYYALVLLSSLLLCFSCSNENDKLWSDDDSKVLSSDGMTRTSSSQLPDLETVKYYDNIKTIMIATDIFTKPSVNVSYENLMDNDSTFIENPMRLKLQSLDIINEDDGWEINFYDLPREQQEIFIDKLLEDERNDLLIKIETMPELGEAISIENNAIDRVIERNNLTLRQVGDTENWQDSDDTGNIVLSSQKTLANSNKIFIEIRDEIVNEYDKPIISPSVANNGQYVNPLITRTEWAKHSRRGDFVVSLPMHGYKYVFINFGRDWRVGHAGIINTNITANTNLNRNATIECISSGVQQKSINYWDSKHYIMGIQKVTIKWKWRGFKSGFYRVKTPVSNPYALANWALQYEGREYVKWYEFLTAKWAAPARFTCTTLVWWCSKKAYGINVSSWYSPLVTPSGLYSNAHTYLRGEVK